MINLRTKPQTFAQSPCCPFKNNVSYDIHTDIKMQHIQYHTARYIGMQCINIAFKIQLFLQDTLPHIKNVIRVGRSSENMLPYLAKKMCMYVLFQLTGTCFVCQLLPLLSLQIYDYPLSYNVLT
jgi:hypothetical protein